MKRTFTKIVLFLVTALFFTGCLEVDTTIHLNKDGSGTLEETVLMSSTVVQMLSSFATSFDSTSADTNKFTLFRPDELINDTVKYGSGIKYVSGKEVKEDGREGYNVVYSFDNINKLKVNQNPNSKIDMQGMESEEDTTQEFLHFDFEPGNPSTLSIKLPSPKEQEVTDESSSQDSQDSLSSNTQQMEALTKLMRDMRIVLKLDVNGNITRTNASYVNGSEITLFDIKFNELLDNPEKLKLFKKQSPKNLDEIKKIVENLPGVKIELNKEVQVSFE
jgi:hypothetical protein